MGFRSSLSLLPALHAARRWILLERDGLQQGARAFAGRPAWSDAYVAIPFVAFATLSCASEHQLQKALTPPSGRVSPRVLVFDTAMEPATPSDACAQSELLGTMLEGGIIQPTVDHDTCIMGLDPELVLAELRRLDHSVVFVSGPTDGIGVKFAPNWDMVDVHLLQAGAAPGPEITAGIRVISFHSPSLDPVIRDYKVARVGGKWSFQLQEGETP